MTIPCGNPLAQYSSHQDAIDAAISGACRSGRYILGPEVERFEREFADYIGVKHAIGVANGTDALHLALRASGIGPGDEVITVAHTAVATVAAIELAGALPVFVDVEPTSLTLDPTQLPRVVSDRTKAIIAVHIYGRAANLPAIHSFANEHGLTLIEDCAQSHGARTGSSRTGSVGAFGCFSFYPTKNLGGLGDGGMVVTDSEPLAGKVRLLREYGWKSRYVSEVPGLNSRLDEIQAAVLRVKLPHLDAANAARRHIAHRYDAGLTGTGLVLPARAPDDEHVYHLYVVRSRSRDRLQELLQAAGVGTLVHYPVPVHLQPAYRSRCRGSERLPETERAAHEVLSLPMYPELSTNDVDRVIHAVQTAVRAIA